MERFPFLSDEWTAEVRRLHDEVVTKPAAATQSVRMNLVLTELPFRRGHARRPPRHELRRPRRRHRPPRLSRPDGHGGLRDGQGDPRRRATRRRRCRPSCQGGSRSTGTWPSCSRLQNTPVDPPTRSSPGASGRSPSSWPGRRTGLPRLRRPCRSGEVADDLRHLGSQFLDGPAAALSICAARSRVGNAARCRPGRRRPSP